MAVVIARQKMTVRTSEGEITIFPSGEPQALPYDLLSHPHFEAAKQSGWITVVSTANDQPADEPADQGIEEPKTSRKRRG
ncbi:hypothetical protein DYQ86_16120 [Acidobacteria bacterium AB60]|nr:hypothetical protein DYQ86_16120 [Acidobacteria bacterium AB60]